MSHFKAKMHQIQFRLGLRPRPRWGSLSAPPHPLAAIRGSTSKGKGRGKGGERRGREGEREGKGEREGREKGKGGERSPLLHADHFNHCC